MTDNYFKLSYKNIANIAFDFRRIY